MIYGHVCNMLIIVYCIACPCHGFDFPPTNEKPISMNLSTECLPFYIFRVKLLLLDHNSFRLELHATRISLSAISIMYNNLSSIVFLQLLLVVFSFRWELYEGNQCTLENGSTGVCKKLPDCPPRLAEVEQGERSWSSTGRCGFDNFYEIVCCPMNISEKAVRRPADVACEQYDKKVNETKDLALHIFGGIRAQRGEFPFVVALGYENDDLDEDPSPIKYSCGGSLISSGHVLTAAHCVRNINDKVPKEVRIGNEDLNSTAKEVQRIPISDIISHPQYKRSTHYNDVAILKLKIKVEFSDTVKPICLYTKPLQVTAITPRTSFVVIGWGSTSFDVENSVSLMKTPSLSIVKREECEKFYTGFLKLPRGIDDNLICAIDRNRTRRADACQGDSGGPLLMLSEKGHTVIGITAFGQTCGSAAPGVYTAVYSYLEWIEQHVWIDDKKEEDTVRQDGSRHLEVVQTPTFFNITLTYG